MIKNIFLSSLMLHIIRTYRLNFREKSDKGRTNTLLSKLPETSTNRKAWQMQA